MSRSLQAPPNPVKPMLGDRHGRGRNSKDRCRGGASTSGTAERWKLGTYVRRVRGASSGRGFLPARRPLHDRRANRLHCVSANSSKNNVPIPLCTANRRGHARIQRQKSPQESFLDRSSLRQVNILPFARDTTIGRQPTNGELSRLLLRPEASVSVKVHCQAQAHFFMLLRARKRLSLVHFEAVNGIVTTHCSTK